METIQATANELLLNAALGIMTLLAACVMFLIQKATVKMQVQTAQIKDAASRKLLRDALADVESLAMLTVGALEQTTAAALRQAVKAGTADREGLLKLGAHAFNEVKTAITPEAQRLITQNLGSFDDYLTKCIEDAVRRVKQEDPYLTLEGELLSSIGQ